MTDVHYTPQALLVTSYELCKMILSDERFSSERAHLLRPSHPDLSTLLSDWSLFNDGKKARALRSSLLDRFHKTDLSLIMKGLNPQVFDQETCIFSSIIEPLGVEILASTFKMKSSLLTSLLNDLYRIIDYIFSTPATNEKVEAAVSALKNVKLKLHLETDLAPTDYHAFILLLIGGLFLPAALAGSFIMASANIDLLKAELTDEEYSRLAAESLRLFAPSRMTTRLAKENVTLGGFEFPVGATVILSLAEANRDSRAFHDPEVIDLNRPNTPLSFGFGEHRCLGERLTLESCANFLKFLHRHGLLARRLQWRAMPNNGLNFITELKISR